MLLLLAPAGTLAQLPEPPPQAPIVSSIDIQFEGARNVSQQNIFAHILLRQGEPFSQTLADQSIRALYESGNFDYIELRETSNNDGTLGVIFVVVPKYRIATIRFEGVIEEDIDDLEDEIELAEGLPLDPVAIKRASVKIFEYYQNEGYANAKVTYETVRNDANGTGEVIFRIEEGNEYTINDIYFEGNDSIDEDDLEDVMETGEYFFLWSWITGSGRLERDVFRKDLGLLREFYRNAGFLDVEIKESDVRIEYPDDDEIDIAINVVEGRRYFIGKIDFSDNTLIETDVLLRVLEIREGDIFSPQAISENIERIKDYYGQYGYLDTFVRVDRKPDVETGIIDITFSVREGDTFFVESITIQGNTKTKSEVIVRELALAPGDVFDLVRMKTSEARLRNTRYFEDVKLSPEATNIPGRRNLRINVEEAQTGNLTFGAGFSTLESIVAFMEFSQSNFDLFNHRSWFQGAGQKFRVRLSLGTESNAFILAFEEPWIFNRRMAFGFELYRNETDFVSTVYNELRMGIELYVRRRLFELVQGRLSYRVEQVEINDVDNSAPSVIQREEGTRSVSTVGFNMTRDTRDAFVWTTRGSRLQSISEFAGLGGQTRYIRQEFRASKWWLLFEDPFDQTLLVHARTGTIFGYSGRSVPFFDKYFLGGPYTIRGFDFRDVGPKDGDDPIGGQSMGLGQIEYTIRFVEPLGLAAFYDVGFVNANDFDWGVADYNDSYGFGARISVLGAPLNLDFAWPITGDGRNEEGLQFNFSFGTTF